MPRILFIDDEPDLLALYLSWCRDWRFEARAVENPVSALEVAAEFQPDLIFLDLAMPELCGFDVLDIFKADARVANLPVVILTGSASSVKDKVRGLDGGAIDYLLKPIHPDEVLARVNSYLSTCKRAEAQAKQRELAAVKSTATFLNHSINNLLQTIEITSVLAAESEDADDRARARSRLISDNVQAIADIVRRLKDIKRVITTQYVGEEMMLELQGSTKDAP